MLSHKVFGQISPLWAPDESIWHYTYYNRPLGVQYLTLEARGDTVIGDTTARVIIQKVYDQNGVQNSDRPPVYLYQDNKRIYYWVKNRFTLLYNFEAEVGDTLTIIAPINEFQEDSVMYFRVDSTATLSIANQILDRQYLTPIEKGAAGYAVQFSGWNTELFGNEMFLIPVDQIVCDSECPEGLRCYGDNNVQEKFVDFPCDTIDLLVSARDNQVYGSQISIWPNPAFHSIHVVRTGFPVNRKVYLRISDLSGKVVVTNTELSNHIQEQKINFDPGLYFVTVWCNNWVATKKLIVSN
jgi:hypothetical protein